jgi:23S rRNA pseudouridine955/2504/2580 synthase
LQILLARELDSTGIQPLSQREMHEIVLNENETAKTLEKFLARKFPIGYVRKVFRKNAARINGRRAKDSDWVRPGDRIQLYIPFETAQQDARAIAASSPLEAIFEDESLLVINKPAGMAVQEGKTVSKRASILGVLESRYRGSETIPRLIHRLDKDTSGLLLIAKNGQTAEELIDAFQSREVVKEYACLVVGRLSSNEGKIDLPLPGREGHLVRALTRYRVVNRFEDTTFVRVIIDTGRLHQIRLHFVKLGYPVVLDDQHGDFGFNKRFRKAYGLKRQFLHAKKLRIRYRGKTHEWSAPLTADLRQVLAKLEKR